MPHQCQLKLILDGDQSGGRTPPSMMGGPGASPDKPELSAVPASAANTAAAAAPTDRWAMVETVQVSVCVCLCVCVLQSHAS